MKEIEELKKYEIFGKPLFNFWYKEGNLNGFNVIPDICEFTEKNYSIAWNSGWINHYLISSVDDLKSYLNNFSINKLPRLLQYVNDYYYGKQLKDLSHYKINGDNIFNLHYSRKTFSSININPRVLNFGEYSRSKPNEKWRLNWWKTTPNDVEDFLKEVPNIIEFVNNYYKEHNLNFKVEK